MDWEQCIEESNIIKISPNKERAYSLLKSSKNMIEFVLNIKINEKNSPILIKDAYEALLELLHSLLYIKGYKVLNHVCVGYFIRDELKDKEIAEKYSTILEKGKKAFEEKLWNGQYYSFDSSKSDTHDSIMADQLAGLWYTNACGLPPIVPHENAKKAMHTVFNFNVLGFQDGEMGAMNGMRPDGTIDRSCSQSSEVWTGTTYAVAALMIQEGLVDEGLKTAHGAYKVTYADRGYWFRTPEAWTERGNFRATMYMRPLAIWAIEHALRASL